MTNAEAAAAREKRSPVLLVVGVVWLPLVVNFVPWTYHIARQAIRGTQFTVDPWTLANPFLTVILVPTSLVVAWCRHGGVAAVLLVIPAAGWVLHQVFIQRLYLLQEPTPVLVRIQLLSLGTLLIIGAYAWRTLLR
jgi:hypothetical protein